MKMSLQKQTLFDIKKISVYDFLKLTKSMGILDRFYYGLLENKNTYKRVSKNLGKIKKVIHETENNYEEAKNTDDLFNNVLGNEIYDKILKSV